MRRLIVACLLAMAVVMGVECAVFNLPFWATVGASTDTASARNAMGPGLTLDESGLLEVTDPTTAWLEVEADGTSGYARIDRVGPEALERVAKTADGGDANGAKDSGESADSADTTDSGDGAAKEHANELLEHLTRTLHVRVDVDGAHGRAVSVSVEAPRSLYLKVSGAGTVRVWFQESRGAVLPVSAVRANVRVPFSFSPARVGVMLLGLLALAALRPGSRLWRIRLDTSATGQRLAFAAGALAVAAITAVSVAWQVSAVYSLVFHHPGGYTYDFDQYGHLADSLLAGRTWLDLPVPDELAAAADPHDVATRDALLAQGVSPIYWDYAFYEGKWYSYFGVLPALLLFAPYRALTGRMLPSGAAVQLLMACFLIIGALLVIRLVKRLAPRASLGATTVALLVFLFGSNTTYLCYRTNFYSVPFAASLTLTALGLWLWLGADTGQPPLRNADRWSVEGARPLSLPRLALGALCIAANIGCRPTFALTSLLAFPLFWPQIRALARGLRAGRLGWRHALGAPVAVLAPAMMAVVPQLAYNMARFGSPLDFGDAYQMTVTDMGRFTLPAADILPMLGYYLFAPLRLTDAFPWVAISPTPLPGWGFAEPLVGGLVVLCPFILLAFALPFLRRRMRDGGQWGLMASMLALGLALVVFDTLRGGLAWRYMADFGWLFALAALPALLGLLDWPQGERPGNGRDNPGLPLVEAATAAISLPRRLGAATIKWAVALLLVVWGALTVLMCFTPGRQDQLIGGNPAMYHEVAAWFRLI